jgi:hypothetical protein
MISITLVIVAIVSVSSQEFFGVGRPADVSEADWHRAIDLFTRELSRTQNGSSTSLLHSRNGTVSDVGFPCLTEGGMGLKCIDEPSSQLTATASRDCVFLHGTTFAE